MDHPNVLWSFFGATSAASLKRAISSLSWKSYTLRHPYKYWQLNSCQPCRYFLTFRTFVFPTLKRRACAKELRIRRKRSCEGKSKVGIIISKLRSQPKAPGLFEDASNSLQCKLLDPFFPSLFQNVDPTPQSSHPLNSLFPNL